MTTRADLVTLDYAFGAQPAAYVAAVGPTDTTLDYVSGAQPFVAFGSSGNVGNFFFAV
jgi:hypothetical protein